MYDPELWNVHGMSNRIIARTNNPLERFNREMNDAFATPHPNMATFVTTIEQLSRRHVATLEAVRGRRAARRTVESIVLPTAADLGDTSDYDSSSEEGDGCDASDDNSTVNESDSNSDREGDNADGNSDRDDDSVGGYGSEGRRQSVSSTSDSDGSPQGDEGTTATDDHAFEYEAAL